MQQRDVGRFIIKTNSQSALNIAQLNAEYAVVVWNVRQLIAESTMFAKLKLCFDQFKINGIRVKIVPVGLTTPANGYMQAALAWDRTGVNVQNINYDLIASYGSAKINYYGAGAKTTMSHFLSAESISEKSFYLDCDDAVSANQNVWRPCLLFGVKAPSPVTELANSYSISYAIEWSFDLTFRGTRNQ